MIGRFLNVVDTRGGVEPGFVPYVRDERYEEAVATILLDQLLKWILAIHLLNILIYIWPTSRNNGQPDTLKKLGLDLDTLKKLKYDPGSVTPSALSSIHDAFRSIENNCGEAIVDELEKLPERGKLDKYLIKQDYKDPKYTGAVSISRRRAAMTARAKELGAEYGEWGKKAHAKAHNIGRLQWKKNANKNGFMESMSTRLASASGMETQVQGIIKASYEKPPHSKLLTMTKLQEGFGDFEGRLLGGTPKDGNFVVEMERDANGKSVPKRDADGYFQSDKSIKGLGENLVAVLRQDDFDFLGSKGSNKGIVNNKFFGIDFGHAYERDNKIVGVLATIFHLNNPKEV